MALHIPRLVLHIGLHKTGTKTLQAAFRSLRMQLRDHGTGVIVHRQVASLPHAYAGAARLTADPGVAPQFQKEIRQLVEKEARRVERRSGRALEQVLISSEHLVGARMPSLLDYPVFRPQMEGAITEMVEALRPDEVHVVLYTRRQDRFMESCYLWEIRKGLSHSIQEQFPFMDEPVMSFSELGSRLLALPHVDSLRVRPFEIIGAGAIAYCDDFLTSLGLAGTLDYSVVDEDLSANQSYSQSALQVALEINHRMETRGQQKALHKFLRKHFPVTVYPPASILTDRERRALLDMYREDNERLFVTWMPDLPRNSYATPAATKKLASVLPRITHRGR